AGRSPRGRRRLMMHPLRGVLGTRYHAPHQHLVPIQMVGGTGVGDAGAAAYSRTMGLERETFLARFGAPMPQPVRRPPCAPPSCECDQSNSYQFVLEDQAHSPQSGSRKQRRSGGREPTRPSATTLVRTCGSTEDINDLRAHSPTQSNSQTPEIIVFSQSLPDPYNIS